MNCKDLILLYIDFCSKISTLCYVFGLWITSSCTQPAILRTKRYLLHSLRQELASWRLGAFENQLKLRTDKDFVWRVFIGSLHPLENPFFSFLFLKRERPKPDFEEKKITRLSNEPAREVHWAKYQQELLEALTQVQRTLVCMEVLFSLVLS